MTPFMKLVADDLYDKMGGNFQNTTIIFPNKRASLFFSEYLWEKAGGKTIWAPEYTTISDMFAMLSRYTHADPIFLAIRLFDVFKKVMRSDTKSIDQAYPLMEMMLSDFQDIDNNMVDPEKLFINIADIKEMTDFSFLTDEQKTALERFFGHFLERTDSTSKLKSNFMTMWNKMPDIYNAFRDSLLNVENDEKAMVYEGMMKRMVIDDLMSCDEATRTRMESRLNTSTYVTVGFNVLNKTEMMLFRYLKEHRDTKFYWDYDEVYTRCSNQTRMQSKYEAGQFILEDIKALGSEFTDASIFRNMQKPKNITFIQSPTDNAQTRYVEQWIRETVNINEPLRETAVILCDENLLQPVLHSIPATLDMLKHSSNDAYGQPVKDNDGHSNNKDTGFEKDTATNEEHALKDSEAKPLAVNVTMGYPLCNTPVFSLIQALMDLQIAGCTMSGSWRYKYVAAVMKHPLIRQLAGKACDEKLAIMNDDNMAFPPTEIFSDNDLLMRIFRHVGSKHLTAYLIDIITLAGRCYQHVSGSKDFNAQMQKEAIFTAYTCINRLRLIMEKEHGNEFGNETLARLIIQLLKGASIPFHGEPAAGLQVMGLLETRNLDFRNIIMLSVNEGKMPKADKRPSLIPYSLKAAFGMTTIEREVSLYAYYYYRLMQRAENVTMIYNSSTEGGSKGEMSRFMLQTLAEAGELLAPGQVIDTRAFTSRSTTSENDTLAIEKTDEVMERLNKAFEGNRILSPSALNTYNRCHLQFYFHYVANLKNDDEVSDDIDSSLFGTIFHYTMQRLYEPYKGQAMPIATIKSMRHNEALLEQTINNGIAVQLFHYKEKDAMGHYINYAGDEGRPLLLNGTQLINRHVIKEFVQHQLNADARMAEELESNGGYMEIAEMETKHTAFAEVECDGPAASLYEGGKKRVLLGGIIDRTDRLVSTDGHTIRIVDYKTSSKQHTAKYVEELFNKDKCYTNYHIFQTFYYAHVLANEDKANGNSIIAPALMYCAKEDEKSHSGIVKLSFETSELNKEGKNKSKSMEVKDFGKMCGEEFSTRLHNLIKEIFSNGENERFFTQCENEDACTYCDFINICQRRPKKKY